MKFDPTAFWNLPSLANSMAERDEILGDDHLSHPLYIQYQELIGAVSVRVETEFGFGVTDVIPHTHHPLFPGEVLVNHYAQNGLEGFVPKGDGLPAEAGYNSASWKTNTPAYYLEAATLSNQFSVQTIMFGQEGWSVLEFASFSIPDWPNFALALPETKYLEKFLAANPYHFFRGLMIDAMFPNEETWEELWEEWAVTVRLKGLTK